MEKQNETNQEVLSGEMVPKVKWEDSEMKTAYANVVNAASTREEVVLFFGTNQTWNVREENEVNVGLSNRIVVSPYAAKRLTLLLDKVLGEYEKRFGELALPTTNDTGQ